MLLNHPRPFTIYHRRWGTRKIGRIGDGSAPRNLDLSTLTEQRRIYTSLSSGSNPLETVELLEIDEASVGGHEDNRGG
ncbi:hypothetical protein HRbin01_00730 [archaeon HR01]|nr:hypothetical protein HRbin01_00730 [archaeon HR01]